jgi:hypothetical protein
VPVQIDDPHPAGSSGLTQALLALTYDPAVVNVATADIHLGTVPASGTGWTLQSRIDAVTGQIGVVLFSTTPIQASDGGSLVTIDFHVQRGAAAAPVVQLVTAVNPDARGEIRTALDDLQGPLTLQPAPAPAPTNATSDVQGIAVHNAGPAAGSAAVGGEGFDADRQPAMERGAIDLSLAGFPFPVQWDDEGPAAAALSAGEVRALDHVFADYSGASPPADDLLTDRALAEGRAWVLARLEDSSTAWDGLAGMPRDDPDASALSDPAAT